MSSLSVQPTTNSSVAQYPGNNTIQPGGNPELYAVLATASVTISNSGEVAGAAVPQLYVSTKDAALTLAEFRAQVSSPQDSVPEGTPVRALRGFEKRTLAPGGSETIQFMLTRRDLSYWDVDAQQWALPASGDFTLQVGWSSRDLPLNATLSLAVDV